MNRIKDSNRALDNARQRTTYYYGMELFTNLNFKEAGTMLEQSINSKGDIIEMRASAVYWLAEAYYRQNRYDLALPQYLKYLETPGAYSKKEYRQSNYNIGYIYFKQKKYVDAIKWFNNYVDRPSDDPRFIADAYARIGDCFYTQRQFERAIEAYTKSITPNHLTNNEYAYFQKGISYGLINRQEDKINSLKFFNNYPTSIYSDMASFEIAKAYTRLGNNSEAIKSYQYIVNTYPQSLLATRSQLQSGLLSFNTGENHKAIEYLKKVIDKHPASSEANEALSILKNIYLEMNEIETYFDYAKTLNNGKGISSTEQDSLMFLAAERIYLNGDYQKSVSMFQEYTAQFSNSQYISNAEFYKAQSELKLLDSINALISYKKIIDMPRNVFTVQALYQTATINFKKRNYSSALSAYQQLAQLADAPEMRLEAKTGIMRSNVQLKRYSDIITASNNVLDIATIPQELQLEAIYNRATSNFETNDFEQALPDYRKLSSNTRIAEGAEAKYRIAQIAFMKQNYDLAEQEIFDLINQATPHYIWLGKSFILLATIYKQKGDTFQAKAYLQSLLDNYPVENDEIKRTATEYLNEIIKSENQKFDDRTQDVIIDISKQY
jgi:TolA-binding protein